MNCIFCKESALGATVSHILPASLGGGEWACLQDGIVCSACNQYFGEKVEGPALDSFPFLPFRLFLGIPTRKGKAPTTETHLGTIRALSGGRGFGLDPKNTHVEAGIKSGRISQLRVLAEPDQTLAICRMLVKMGVEVVAADCLRDAHDKRFDSARAFARCPARGTEWWWAMYTNHQQLFAKFRYGLTNIDWAEDVSLSVCQFEDFEAFRLQLLDMVLFTPLDARVAPPDFSEFSEPDFRIFRVKC